MGLLGAVIVVALALVTASVAETKGQSGLLWYVLGLFFPVVSLLIAALLHPTGDAAPVPPSIEEAVRSSSVACALHGATPQSAHQLQGQLGEDEREVLRQLSALDQLDLADRDSDGRWALTELALTVLVPATTPNREERPITWWLTAVVYRRIQTVCEPGVGPLRELGLLSWSIQ